ncbi:hypothetical protein BCR36DRAFT_395258 [Piromyces finnis]|uniref:EGF-like domain-containing protein n=1 Tax=Piromyces finnis TaxID=1754191 RepID=A0A1Y1VI75_9FUNG|nr:hypothetical protein BCR36DRAFT_395258 [Piromyces finnis]|eukprot:ORX57107.1 hypothetical protein BCR36DRAFT_395258 [Piromyces finnis]
MKRKWMLNIFYLFFILFFGNALLKVIPIRNNDNSFTNILNILKENENDKELILKFEDYRYDMRELDFAIEHNVKYSIIFSGNKNGTIFDYGSNIKGKFRFYFVENRKEIIKFENIIFENFNNEGYNANGIFMLLFSFKFKNTYNIIFENCTFKNNSQDIINFSFEVLNINDGKPTITFNRCNFYQNREKIIFSKNDSFRKYISYDSSNNNIIKMNDCRFIDNNGMFYSEYTNFIFKNYIITLFEGDNNKYTITNTIFKDINLKNSLPLISDSKYSTFNISNIELKNIKLTNQLFNEESDYYFDNINLNNVITNSKYLFYFLNHNIVITNFYAENIQCLGDEIDTSLISLLSIYNSTLSNNINTNKVYCGGIHFNNEIIINVSNTTFKNNSNKSNGGALCSDNITNLELNLMSNKFFNNSATNGGVIYLMDKKTSINYNRTIFLENNSFEKNSALNFGGAIFYNLNSPYSINANNNNFTSNEAEIMGGGIFCSNFNCLSISKLNNIILKNNKINSYINNYSSRPSYLGLNTSLNNNIINITTGDLLSLKFTLYDIFNNTYIDYTKYYSSLTLKVLLIEKNNILDNHGSNEKNKIYSNVSLIGNVGWFIDGICELKHFRIYAIPNIYSLKIIIDGYNGDIIYKFNDILIKVNDCEPQQIRMINKYNIPYCEKPICHESCPDGKSAECIKSSNSTNINDINLNICQCLPGFTGEKCDIKVFVNYR